jgi:sensor c-di-GMP phosphodiesterase-like protein
MLIPKSRIRVVAVALLLAAGMGAVSGYFGGRLHTRQSAEAQLRSELAIHSGHLKLLMDESRSLLDAMNRSAFPYCSAQEMAWARDRVYHSVNLRDFGRMRSGRMECSALYDRQKLPDTSFQPTLIRPDGMSIYRNLPPYSPGWNAVYILQFGQAYVVEDPNYVGRWAPRGQRVETSMYDRRTRRWMRPAGLPPSTPGAIIDRDAQGIVGDTLFLTGCVPSEQICTTVYGSFSDALAANTSELVIDSALGGLSCAFLVVLYVLLWEHKQSVGQQLRRAIRSGDLHLTYQPIVELSSRRIVEAEALVRWSDEDGYAVKPEEFVRVAEEQGFISELTALVVRLALKDFAEVLRNHPAFRLNINISAWDLEDENFLPMLEDALDKARVAPQSLTLELTETSTARKQIAMKAIQSLRERGHGVQIDDFGTGYSSLAYLHDLHVDGIKIDKIFTHAIGTEAMTAEILPQILSMAEHLGLQVIAEGIETEEQASFFANRSTPVLGQGWLFGRPAPASEFLLRLEAHSSAGR